MAQARRKASKARGGGRGWSGLGLLIAGMVSGALAMQLWHGAQSGGVGAGLRALLERQFGAREAAPAPASGEPPADAAKPATDFTFFTVLPEIEVVAPAPPADAKPAPVAADSASAADAKSAAGESPRPAVRDATPADPAGRFMLQAGSYRSAADAERLKATLALSGLASSIQKVTIQGRGDFYRVRLGPFPTYQAMVDIDRQLSRAGIKALRLKMKSG